MQVTFNDANMEFVKRQEGTVELRCFFYDCFYYIQTAAERSNVLPESKNN